MKRGPAPKRRKPLVAKTGLRRGPMKRKRRKASPLLKQARRLAVERAEGLCEARWAGCAGRGEHAHHVRRRSQGGDDTVDNLLMVCHRCHGEIHANPALAAKKGHLKLARDA